MSELNNLKKFSDAWYIFIEKNFSQLIDEIVHPYVDELRVLWGYGNGEGGDLIERLRFLLGDNSEEKPSNKYQKKIISSSLRDDVFIRDGHTCQACGTKRMLCVDHIYPESLGGKSEISNLQTLCRPCNSRKGKKPYLVGKTHDLVGKTHEI